jgi:glycosyltransferase involved in cell wall biosynthesis
MEEKPPPDRKVEVIDNRHVEFDTSPELSIIIPTFDANRSGFFENLLHDIAEQSYRDFEVIIVKGDNRQGRAINTGAGVARGKFLLTLDDDTRLMSKDSIQYLANVVKNDNKVGLAGGINIIPKDASSFTKRVMTEIPRRSTPDVKEITESDLAEHPLLMIRKDIFFKVGGENELIPRGLDPYLRMKFRHAGYKVVIVPLAYYAHLPPNTFKKLVMQFFRNGRLSAYCNKFFPEFVIETPAKHTNRFVEQRAFFYRAGRYVFNFISRAGKGHWIYISALSAYALGFLVGYCVIKDVKAS